MADFPALEPLDRSYGLGAHPISSYVTNAQDATRFLHGSQINGIEMAVEFVCLSAAQVQQIRDHYAGQLGTVRSFAIPAQMWRLHASLFDVAPSYLRWRYQGPPTETARTGGLFDVSLQLVTT